MKESTERVQRYRKRQQAAGRKRIAFYLDQEIADTLEHVAGSEEWHASWKPW